MSDRILPALEATYLAVDGRLRRSPHPVKAPAVSSEQVGVVVQGPVIGRPTEPPDQRHTERVLRSVRRAVPGAQVVLSTWKGSDLTGLDVDLVVLNDDPGPTRLRGPSSSWLNNVNRQVVSTRAGLERINRPLAMKLRSDLELVDGRALSLFGGWPARAPKLQVFRERILVPSFYTFRHGRVFDRFPYQVSDWFQLGLHEDLLDLWSTPQWDVSFEWLLGRRTVSVEQWIWMSLLNRHDEDARFDRPDLTAHSALSVVNNTVVLEHEDLGLRFLKFEPALRHRVALLTHGEWQRQYERCCLGKHRYAADPQGVLRTVVARAWIRGLGARLFGEAFDINLDVAPVSPPATPNQAEVLSPPQATGRARLLGSAQ